MKTPTMNCILLFIDFRMWSLKKRVAVMMICLAVHVSVTGGESESNAELWSFQPVSKVEVPLRDDPWVRQPVDGFILAGIRDAGMEPTEQADKTTWLRRVTYDLTGLPPTKEEYGSYLNDDSAGAETRVVDRLLASPRYGERWASYWLDGVRYVEEVGYFNFGNLGWRYRDWVIDALNNDMPYDRFIIHQIAGDLLPDPLGRSVYPEGVIATGFLCMGNYDDQESDKERLYAEVADDQIDVVTRQFLGLTVSCARCHDHKFDPVSMRDYYAMAGIFMSTRVLTTDNRIGAKRLEISIPLIEDTQEIMAVKSGIGDIRRKLEASADKSPEKSELEATLQSLRNHLARLEGTAMGAVEGGYDNSRHNMIGDMPIYERGNPQSPGEIVPRGVISRIAGSHDGPIGARTSGSGRLELAQWIADSENPLTARVMVNRLWQHHFGHGLVRTASNFGSLGEKPTHPELLDWLAQYFVESGWSIKAMHRVMVLSAAYRQRSDGESSIVHDPENRLFSRYLRRRLTAEQLHDSLLAVSGQFRPEARNGSGARAIFTYTGHLRPWREGQVFDAPPAGTMVAKRDESNTTPQALYLMNDASVIDAAKATYQHLSKGHPDDMIRHLWWLVYGRTPTPPEQESAQAFIKSSSHPWMLCHVLLCSNEFLHID